MDRESELEGSAMDGEREKVEPFEAIGNADGNEIFVFEKKKKKKTKNPAKKRIRIQKWILLDAAVVVNFFLSSR